MNIIIAPDSFKGSLSSIEVGEIIKEAFKQVLPYSNVNVYPMADGGEGTIDALVYSTKGKIYYLNVTGPEGKRVNTYYGVLGDGETIVIDIANIVGIDMVGKKDPINKTTFGIGEILLHCIRKGYRKFILGLGGSATNDGGMGMLQALGVKFKDYNGCFVSHYASGLYDINSIDIQNLSPLIKDCEITVAYDVNNQLCGENGSTYIYGPQKGIKSHQLASVDNALKSFANLLEKQSGNSLQFKKGSGAAGGLGFAFLFLGTSLKPGAELIAQVLNLDEKFSCAHWVITGEGSSDYQSIFGKTPIYIAKLAKRNEAKAILLSGSLGKGYEELSSHFMSCHSIITRPLTLQEAIDQSKDLLYKSSLNIANIIKEFEK